MKALILLLVPLFCFGVDLNDALEQEKKMTKRYAIYRHLAETMGVEEARKLIDEKPYRKEFDSYMRTLCEYGFMK